jgi:hypothetical protein
LGEDTRLPLLLKAIRREPDFLSYKLSDGLNRLVTENAQLMELYRKNRKMLGNAVVLQEFLKELASCLQAKELIVDMIAQYALVKEEDTRFEAAMDLCKRMAPPS